MGACHVWISQGMMTSLPSSVTMATPANREMPLSSPWLSTCPVSIPPSFPPSLPDGLPVPTLCFPLSANTLFFTLLWCHFFSHYHHKLFIMLFLLSFAFSLGLHWSTHRHTFVLWKYYNILRFYYWWYSCNFHISTHLCESGCEMALTIASTAVSKSSGSGRALKQSCTRSSLSLRGTSSSTQDDRQRSTRAFTAPGLSVCLSSCCSKGHTDPHSRPRAPRT